MKEWKPKQFIELIDLKYNEAKRKRLSRYSLEWGLWSQEMNVILRERINSKTDPFETDIKYVINYWLVKSSLLELYYKSSILNQGIKKRLAKEAKRIRSYIK